MKNSVFVKIISLIFSIIFIFCNAVACGCGRKSEDIPDGQEAEYKPIVLTSNGESIDDYSIVISSSAKSSDEYAAKTLQNRIKQATGYELSIIRDGENEKLLEIILGKTTRKECQGIDYAALGEESYKVNVADKDLVIAGNDRGLIYGVYAYLEALGFRFYTTDTEKIPHADEVFVPKTIDLSWTPVFEYRETMYSTTWNADFALSQKINSDFQRGELKNNSKYGGYVGYIGGGSWLVHTFQYLLPKSQYFSAHPEYFAEVDGARGKTAHNYPPQPCFSNEEAYQEILKNALAKIASEPNGKMISISENDGSLPCTCSECSAQYAQYGRSGTYYRFINRLAADIAEVYPDVFIDTIAYSDNLSINPPENLQIADNVIVRVCPSMCRFHTDSSKCEQLAKDEKRIADWRKICKNVYIWCYPIVWSNLFAALPNYDEMLYDIKYFAEQGVKGVYAEGYPGGARFSDPEFGELKAYLMAKLLANPNMSKKEYEYHYRDFLEGYYGDAAEYIEQYHAYTKEMIKKNEEENGHYSAKFSVEENFLFEYNRTTHKYDMTDIDYVNDLWDNAVESAGKYLDHVKKSRIHWTYIELYNTMDNRVLYGDEDTREELFRRNEELYKDMKKYNTIRKFDNAYDLAEITDFTISPESGCWLRP